MKEIRFSLRLLQTATQVTVEPLEVYPLKYAVSTSDYVVSIGMDTGGRNLA